MRLLHASTAAVLAAAVIAALPRHTTAISGTPAAQIDALLALYNSTNGTAWRIPALFVWVGEPCVDLWYGVGCDASLNITYVALPVVWQAGAVATRAQGVARGYIPWRNYRGVWLNCALRWS